VAADLFHLMLGFPEQVIALKRISPPTIPCPAAMKSDERMDRAVALLPQPVSPTMPRVSFSSIVKTNVIHGGESAALETELDVRLLTSEQGRFIYARYWRGQNIAQPAPPINEARIVNRNDQPGIIATWGASSI